jgi:hypothetical protein
MPNAIEAQHTSPVAQDEALEHVAAMAAPVQRSAQAAVVIALRPVPIVTQHSCVAVQVAPPQLVAVITGRAGCAGPPSGAGPPMFPPPGVPAFAPAPPEVSPLDVSPLVAVEPLPALVVSPEDTRTGPEPLAPLSPLAPSTFDAWPPQAAAHTNRMADHRIFSIAHLTDGVFCVRTTPVPTRFHISGRAVPLAWPSQAMRVTNRQRLEEFLWPRRPPRASIASDARTGPRRDDTWREGGEEDEDSNSRRKPVAPSPYDGRGSSPAVGRTEDCARD